MESTLASNPETAPYKAAVRLVRDDITLLEVDAFVYYARPDLALGSGFGGAIALRGGATVQKELSQLAADGPIAVGEAVVTDAGKLPAKHIIHAVGPRFREPDIEGKLRRTVRRCLERARDAGVSSIAFPAMGCGYHMIPPTVSARVMVEALSGPEAATLEDIVICVYDTPQYQAFEAALAAEG
jgi:O-acetyl-ADP-ribose deacetylase (regulator of RNase III)